MDSPLQVVLAEPAQSSTSDILIGCCWFLMIGLMFFAQHHVCDAYFVPAINVFVEKMKKSKTKCLNRWGDEAVAGATICALGCNGPELFTNLISLFTHSDAGIGVVVGSEIFNLLIIIGAAVVSAPMLPLAIERAPFTRDCLFYALSIVLLFVTLQDKQVDSTEAGVLLGAAAVYVAAVYFTADVMSLCGKTGEAGSAGEQSAPDEQSGRMHGVNVKVVQILHSRMADGRQGTQENWNLDPTEAGIFSAAKQEKTAPKNRRGSIGFQFAGKPGALTDGMPLLYSNLDEVAVMSEGVLELTFARSFYESVTLKITAPDAEKRDLLLDRIKEYSLGGPWIHKYDPTVVSAWEHLRHTMTTGSTVGEKLAGIVEFVIDVPLKLSLFWCDVKDITKESRWPLCFLGAMTWLAIFSYMMLEIAEAIHDCIPVLPSSFLGITVCAIGTSFPNAVASVIMATQNKPAAAIANALGSNVQNVFLAMALPWVIYLCNTNGQPISMEVAGINEGVAWMMGTLILVVMFTLVGGCTLGKPAGYVLMLVYLGYLIITSGETFGWWPPLVKG